MKAVISSTGLWTPEESITNEELVESFNAYVDIWNSKNSSSIIDGKKLELTYSDAGFIEKSIWGKITLYNFKKINLRSEYNGAKNSKKKKF